MNPLSLAASRRDGLQLVATLGPASLAHARALAEAGATSFRLNASHLTPDALRMQLAAIARDVPELPVVVDLQGEKLRLGTFTPRAIAAGDELVFALDGAEGVPVAHPELFAAARAGELLSCDDDRLRFEIVQVERAGRLVARALGAGTIRARKGLNLVAHPVAFDDLSQADVAHVEASQVHPYVAFALSFMRSGAQAEWIRRRRPDAVLVGKIERQEAIDALASIDAAVDATWICRGDLGAQLGVGRMARVVAAIDPLRLQRPCLMAGQVLELLTHVPAPSRTEVCHLHDLVRRGFAGIVLSDETAVGRDPVNAVRVAAGLLMELAG